MPSIGNVWRFLFALGVLNGALVLCQVTTPTKHRAVLVLVTDQPVRPFAQEMLEGIHAATQDAMALSIFFEFLGPTALETGAVAARRQGLLETRYTGQPIEIVVAIGDRCLAFADKLRNDLFPSAKLLFAVSSPDLMPSGIRQGEGLHVDVSPLPSLHLALSLLPKMSRLVVVGGASTIDQFLSRSLADSLRLLPGRKEVTVLSGLPLPELQETVERLPEDTLLALTGSMADRSGRATTNIDQARVLSTVGRVPVVDGTDISLGHGSLGGDIASFRLAGQEIGNKIRRTLDSSQAAPARVVIDPAPRRKAFDWRELKRLGIPENRVPQGYEILYREPTLWEQNRGSILAILGGLVLQALLISYLLAERRRRAEAQTRMQRQLKLEAMVSKACADLSSATQEELPARLQEVSRGLSESIDIERVSVWIYMPEKRDYVPVHWWPESQVLVRRDTVAQRFPYLHGELLAGRTVTAVGLDKLPPGAALDVAGLRALGFVSLLMIPLKLGEEPIGALVLGTYNHAVGWDTDAISTLQMLANILAQAISRSLAQERERRTEDQNRAMLASLPGFVLMIDSAGQILRQSNRLELSEAELPRALARAGLGQNLLKLWEEDGEGASHVALALEEIVKGDKTSLVVEHRYETDAGARWIEVHAESLCGEQRGAVVSQIDITERKNKESENAQNRQTVWHLNRVAALGELTASLAHEINQPLAAILSSAEAAAVLLKRPSPDIAETLGAVQDIIDDDKRAGAVISRMRSMLKRGHERTQPVDLSATVEETLRLVLNEARLRHVTLRHFATPDLPPVVADLTQLQQVILNLTTNGIEAAEMMPGHREVEIRTSRLANDGMQLLEVRDSGPGIPSGRLNSVFEPFYTSKREGLGLGLSICRSIVDSFGGKITVESPPEGGAVFRVSLRTFVRASEEAGRAMKAGA